MGRVLALIDKIHVEQAAFFPKSIKYTFHLFFFQIANRFYFIYLKPLGCCIVALGLPMVNICVWKFVKVRLFLKSIYALSPEVGLPPLQTEPSWFYILMKYWILFAALFQTLTLLFVYFFLRTNYAIFDSRLRDCAIWHHPSVFRLEIN